LSLKSYASGNVQFHVSGLDAPEEIKHSFLGKSEYTPDGNIKLSCFVFPQYVVLELDEGQKGASELIVRPRSKGTSVSELCKKASSSKSILLKNVSGYFLGASGRYIFEISADSFGVLMGMTVYDAFTGKTMLDTEFNEKNKQFLIERSKDKVSVTYYQRLKVSCFPTHQNGACWKRILKENNIDKDLKIKAPSCKTALSYAPDAAKTPESSLLLTTKVRIDDLSQPKTIFQGGDSTCDAAP
jgi:hypothetical protein